jgi:endonuclease III
MSDQPTPSTLRPPPARLDDAQRLWRQSVVDHLRANVHVASSVSGVSNRALLSTVERETRRIELIAATLHSVFGSPDLGNKRDPVAELVYIALSRRTREAAYQAAFDALCRRWTNWEDVADASVSEVAGIIQASGLSGRKASSIVGALRALRERFGACRLEVDGWSDDEVAAFLTSLPEIGPKSAACVMAMSLDRPAFAVDVHVGRVLARVGPYRELGLHLEPMHHKRRQALLPSLIPPAIRRDLHVNLVSHGRRTCLPRRPSCGQCPIQMYCVTGLSTPPPRKIGR